MSKHDEVTVKSLQSHGFPRAAQSGRSPGRFERPGVELLNACRYLARAVLVGTMVRSVTSILA
jgi:hypothetical protein